MYQRYLKRFFDYLLCIIGLPVFLLLYIVFGLLIRLEDGGPVLYIAERIGKDSRPFKMYKFRSMKVNAPTLLNEDGSTYNSKDDSRVTKIGSL